jgi:ATP-binding cassette subfamily B protein
MVTDSGKDFDFKNEITFENVSYTYEGKSIPALKNLSFTIARGSTFAILGTTGSGKSTLIQLFLRLFDPSEGHIRIDGQDLREINLKNWKKRIGYVPQDIFLFSDTISNNIAFGVSQNGGNLLEDIRKAAKMAALHENILNFPNQYETKVGERGITLSGGQKQRVAIARAFIKDPEILVMDDCLSALDTSTEAQILKNMAEMKKNCTYLIVSHRVSSVKEADNILVLDEGKMVEFGTHDELMQVKGSYSDIYNKQIQEEASN